jgi:hypothetical protein
MHTLIIALDFSDRTAEERADIIFASWRTFVDSLNGGVK